MLEATVQGTVLHRGHVRDEGVRTWLLSFLPSALAALAVSLVAASLLIYFRESLYGLGRWGYLGVLLAELANSASILVPTPAAAYTFAMGSVLNPFALGVIGGVGAACGELFGYYLGARGATTLEHAERLKRLRSITTRWGGGFLLAFALLPLPFDVAGIWAGATRYPVSRFLVFVTAGKVVNVTAIALAGHYGVNWLAGPIG